MHESFSGNGILQIFTTPLCHSWKFGFYSWYAGTHPRFCKWEGGSLKNYACQPTILHSFQWITDHITPEVHGSFTCSIRALVVQQTNKLNYCSCARHCYCVLLCKHLHINTHACATHTHTVTESKNDFFNVKKTTSDVIKTA